MLKFITVLVCGSLDKTFQGILSNKTLDRRGNYLLDLTEFLKKVIYMLQNSQEASIVMEELLSKFYAIVGIKGHIVQPFEYLQIHSILQGEAPQSNKDFYRILLDLLYPVLNHSGKDLTINRAYVFKLQQEVYSFENRIIYQLNPNSRNTFTIGYFKGNNAGTQAHRGEWVELTKSEMVQFFKGSLICVETEGIEASIMVKTKKFFEVPVVKPTIKKAVSTVDAIDAPKVKAKKPPKAVLVVNTDKGIVDRVDEVSLLIGTSTQEIVNATEI